MVVDVGGDLSGAGNSVTVDSTVELDYCGLGGHGGMTVLHQAPLTAEHDAEAPVELFVHQDVYEWVDDRAALGEERGDHTGHR